MKREYVKPTFGIVKINTAQVIAISNNSATLFGSSSGNEGDASTSLGSEYSGSDSEEW